MKITSILSAVALSFLTVTAFGAKSDGAAIGDAAPPLSIKSWVQGGPITFKPGQVTVVEFWATWCPPCRTSIPHINKIQKQYADKQVVVVGVSNEAKKTVAAFIKKMGKDMTYPVAIGDDKMTAGYMQAYNVRGIPHAFVVDAEGKISWHGHPMSGMDVAIEAALAKRDAAAAVVTDDLTPETKAAE